MLLKLTQVSWDDGWLPLHINWILRRFSKPWRVEKQLQHESEEQKKIIDTRDYADGRKYPGHPKVSQNANDVNPADKRHCIMMAAGTKPGGFKGQKKIVLIGEKHQSLSLTSFRLFSPTHPSSVPRDDRTTSLFPPLGPRVSIMPISPQHK